MSSSIKFPMVLILAAMAWAVLMATQALPRPDLSISHASKHGGQALAVRLALRCDGYDHQFINEDTGRVAYCVEFEDDGDVRFGIQILQRIIGGKDQEITSFLMRARYEFDTFVQYMARRGYVLK